MLNQNHLLKQKFIIFYVVSYLLVMLLGCDENKSGYSKEELQKINTEHDFVYTKYKDSILFRSNQIKAILEKYPIEQFKTANVISEIKSILDEASILQYRDSIDYLNGNTAFSKKNTIYILINDDGKSELLDLDNFVSISKQITFNINNDVKIKNGPSFIMSSYHSVDFVNDVVKYGTAKYVALCMPTNIKRGEILDDKTFSRSYKIANIKYFNLYNKNLEKESRFYATNTDSIIVMVENGNLLDYNRVGFDLDKNYQESVSKRFFHN